MIFDFNVQQENESKAEFFTRRDAVKNGASVLNDFFSILRKATIITNSGFTWILEDSHNRAKIILDLSGKKPKVTIEGGNDNGEIGFERVYTIIGYCKWNEIDIDLGEE